MKPVTVIGISGGTCSGKTLVAKRIVEQVGEDNVLICNQDNYYRDLRDLNSEERANWNFDRPEAIDRPLFYQLMTELANGKSVDEPIYDFVNHVRTAKTRRLDPKPVLIIEGILVLNDSVIRDLLDFKIYVDEDSDIRLARRIQRDEMERGRSANSVLDQYLNTVRPMHLKYVEPSKLYADIIIPGGGENLAAIGVLANHIKTLLAQ